MEQEQEVDLPLEGKSTKFAGVDDESAVDFEFDDDPTVVDFQSIPAGTYLCRIDEVRPGTTRNGYKRWSLKYIVHDGVEAGRLAAWDGLVFSPKAAPRTRQVLAALGLPHQGRVRIETKDVIGCKAFITVEESSYTDPATGLVTKRMQVPYGGVRSALDAGKDTQAEAETGADIPF